MLGKNRLIDADSVDNEPNPMEGLANLADVMLVMAVGIMLALIINWNLDISTVARTQDVSVDTENALEFTDEELQKMDGQDQLENNENLTALGSVYYDKKTNTYYIIGEEE